MARAEPAMAQLPTGSPSQAMAYRQQDYVLRLIESLGVFLARVRKLRDEGEHAAALAEIERTVGELLGPTGAVVARLDSATAAQLLGDPRRLDAWAHLLAAEGDVREELGHAAAAEAARRRALELALEAVERMDAARRLDALGRADPRRGEVVRLASALARQVDPGRIADRYQQALRRALGSGAP